MKAINKYMWLLVWLAGMTLPLQGCNLANSADYDGYADEPSASIAIKSTEPSANTDGSYEENTEITLRASGTGSNNSGIQTCDLSLFKLGTDDVFGTTAISSVTGCGETTMVAPSTGTYKLVLTVTDDNQKTAKTEKSIKVSESILNSEFTATQQTNTMQINLDASTSTKGEGGTITSYAWQVRLKVDDSTTTNVSSQTNSSPETKVVVDSDGIYVIQLTVTDAGSNTDVEQQQVAISSSTSLVPEFSFTNSTGFVAPSDLLVQISASEASNLNHLICYLWLYSSGEIAETATYQVYAENSTTQSSCSIPIPAAGLYAVDVKAVNNDGSEHVRRKVIQLN